MKTVKLIAEPLEKGNLRRITKYVYYTYDWELYAKKEQFEKDYSTEKYLHRAWEVKQ